MEVWNTPKLAYTITTVFAGVGFEVRRENGNLAVCGEINENGVILVRGVYCVASCELSAILARVSWLFV
jgi:hypothetical protein